MDELIFNEKIHFQSLNSSQDNSLLNNVFIDSQNCNSLNLGTCSKSNPSLDKFRIKITSLLKGKPDILLIQDIRLGRNLNILEKEVRCHKSGNYIVFSNSTKSERGVAILFRQSLNYEVLKSFKSSDENVLLLDVKINNFKLTLGSIYGPIQANNKYFFKQLKTKISSIGNSSFIILGDLNSIPTMIRPDKEKQIEHLDICNMSSLPNIDHCRELNDWISSDFCIDLFRLLHPLKIEYSYIPYSKTKLNRSRIDHVLCSPNLSNILTSCIYDDSRMSLFDHKMIKIRAIDKKKFKEKCINSSCLEIDGLHEAVLYSVYELILDYYIIENKQQLRNALTEISNVTNLKMQILNCNHKNDLLIAALIEKHDRKINNLCNMFPPIQECFQLNCLITPDLLVEVLLNTIKNTIISYQSNYSKNFNNEKKDLSKQLNKLKCGGVLNENICNQIFNIESKLSSLEDEEIFRGLESSKYFEILNTEKASKSFSKLLKNSKECDSLSQIRNENGEEFISNEKRNDYIKEHFEKKFKTPFKSHISIADFLGEFYDDPFTQAHKLSEDDKNKLESEITLSELKKSLDTANINSSVGPDGIPYKVYIIFWDILKIPLLNGFKFMVNQNELQGLMRYGKIKLIPKKNADLSKIKSWRPIVCLPTIYKLFSGIVANRLKKVMDKIIVKTQKAYSKRYMIQENLISTYEIMAKTLSTNSSLAIAIIDFQSAFDTIGHDYIKEVLRFMNFGPYFLDLVSTCLNKRYAHISTSEGITKNFEMNVSVFQGDRPSADFFKCCLNPLLIYFVLSQEIKIPQSIPFKLTIENPKPDPNISFADDCEFFFEPTPQALQKCLDILNKFGRLSGLKVNENKTKICVVGTQATPDFAQKVRSLNLEIVKKFTMLGINYDYRLESMCENWSIVINKMAKIRNFWALFHLTIPGKISVIKSFILPQLNYVGSVISPTITEIEQIENIIISFINTNRPIAKSKIFSSTDNCGLGIPKIRDLLDSLDVLLYKKSLHINDSWSLELKNTRNHVNDPYYFNKNLDPLFNPILNRVLKSFTKFCNSFWVNHNNIKDIRIFNNPLFLNAEKMPITQAMFTETSWRRFENNIKILKFEDVLSNENKCLSYEIFKDRTQINLTWMEYNIRLRSHILKNIDLYKHKLSSPQNKIEDIMSKPNYKSKHFRKYLALDNQDIKKCVSSTNRHKWASTEEIDINREITWTKTWTFSFIPIEMRDFSFKSVNNYLYFNGQISHFSNEVSPECTFCILNKRLPAPKETIKHFFLDCPTTNSFTIEHFSSFLSNFNLHFSINWLLLGSPSNIPKYLSFIINIEILIISCFLFQMRLKKKQPLTVNFKAYSEWNRKLLKKNSYYDKSFQKFLNPFDPG